MPIDLVQLGLSIQQSLQTGSPDPLLTALAEALPPDQRVVVDQLRLMLAGGVSGGTPAPVIPPGLNQLLAPKPAETDVMAETEARVQADQVFQALQVYFNGNGFSWNKQQEPVVEMREILQAHPPLRLGLTIRLAHVVLHPQMQDKQRGRPDPEENSFARPWRELLDEAIALLSFEERASFLAYGLEYDLRHPRVKVGYGDDLGQAVIFTPISLKGFTVTQLRRLLEDQPALYQKLIRFILDQSFRSPHESVYARLVSDPKGSYKNLDTRLAEVLSLKTDETSPQLLKGYLTGSLSIGSPEQNQFLEEFYDLGSLHELKSLLICDRDWDAEAARRIFEKKNVAWTARYLNVMAQVFTFFYDSRDGHRNPKDPSNVNDMLQNVSVSLEHLTPQELRAASGTFAPIMHRFSELTGTDFRPYGRVEDSRQHLFKLYSDYIQGAPMPADVREASLTNAVTQLGTLGEIISRDHWFSPEQSKPDDSVEDFLRLLQVITQGRTALLPTEEEVVKKLLFKLPMDAFAPSFAVWKPQEAARLVEGTLFKFPFRPSPQFSPDSWARPLFDSFRDLVTNPDLQSPPEWHTAAFLGLGDFQQAWDFLCALIGFETEAPTEGEDDWGNSETVYPRNRLSEMGRERELSKKSPEWILNCVRLLFKSGAPVTLTHPPYYFTSSQHSALRSWGLAQFILSCLTSPQISGRQLDQLVREGPPLLSKLARLIKKKELPLLFDSMLQELDDAKDIGEVVQFYQGRMRAFRSGERNLNLTDSQDVNAFVMSIMPDAGAVQFFNPENASHGAKVYLTLVEALKLLVSNTIPGGKILPVILNKDDFIKKYVSSEDNYYKLNENWLEKFISFQTSQWRLETLKSIVPFPQNADLTPQQLGFAAHLVHYTSPATLYKLKAQPGSVLETIQLFVQNEMSLDFKLWGMVRREPDQRGFLAGLKPKFDAYQRGAALPKGTSEDDLYLAYLAQNPNPASLSFDSFKQQVQQAQNIKISEPFLNEAFAFPVVTTTSVFTDVDTSGLQEVLELLYSVRSKEALVDLWHSVWEARDKEFISIKPILEKLFPEDDIAFRLALRDVNGEFLSQMAQGDFPRNGRVQRLIDQIIVALTWSDEVSGLPLQDQIKKFFYKPQNGREEIRTRGLPDTDFIEGIKALWEFYADHIPEALERTRFQKWKSPVIAGHVKQLSRMQEEMRERSAKGREAVVEAVPSKSEADVAIGHLTGDCSKGCWVEALKNPAIQSYRLVSQNSLKGFLYLQEAVLDGKKVLVLGIQPYHSWGMDAQLLVKAVVAHLAHLAQKKQYDELLFMEHSQRQSNSHDVLGAIRSLGLNPSPIKQKIDGPIFQGTGFLRIWAKGMKLTVEAVEALVLPANDLSVVVASVDGEPVAVELLPAVAAPTALAPVAPTPVARIPQPLAVVIRPLADGPPALRDLLSHSEALVGGERALAHPDALAVAQKTLPQLMRNARVVQGSVQGIKVSVDGDAPLNPQDLFDFYQLVFHQGLQLKELIGALRDLGADIMPLADHVARFDGILASILRTLLAGEYDSCRRHCRTLNLAMEQFQAAIGAVAETIGYTINPYTGQLMRGVGNQLPGPGNEASKASNMLATGGQVLVSSAQLTAPVAMGQLVVAPQGALLAAELWQEPEPKIEGHWAGALQPFLERFFQARDTLSNQIWEGFEGHRLQLLGLMNELIQTHNARALQAILQKYQELGLAAEEMRMWEAVSLVLNGSRSLPPEITAPVGQEVQQRLMAVPVGTPVLGAPPGVAPAATPIGVH